MAESRLLLKIFPELQDLKGCSQNKYHAYDVFEHTMRAFHFLEKNLNNYSDYIPDAYLQTIKQLNKDHVLKFAILLHDIGKPDTRTRDDQGNIHFYGHAQKGAEKADHICKRLKLSNADRYYTNFIISNHTRPLFLFISFQKGMLTKKGITKFFIKCGNKTPALFLHAIADIQGKGDETNERNTAFIEFAKNMLHDFFSDFMPEKIKPPLITGHDLINGLNLQPSPLFKTILNNIQKERLSKRISTKKEALALAKNFLTKPGKNNN
jgi:putative nucleotidyltransferase with HDIG domain